MPRSLGYRQSKRRKLDRYGIASCYNILTFNTPSKNRKKHFRGSNCGDYVNGYIFTPFRKYSDKKEKVSSGPLSVTQRIKGSRNNCLRMLIMLASFLAIRHCAYTTR